MKKYSKSDGWNYRILRVGEGDFRVFEVYYTKGKPTSWSAEHMYPCGETPVEVAEDLSLMFKAFSQPVMEIMSDAKGKEEIVDTRISKVSGKQCPTTKE